jgi:hypothetical protein
VFVHVPDLLAVIRPRAIKEDRVYGPLLRRAIAMAREQSKVVTATRMAESLEDAEEVIFGGSEPGDGPHDAVLVASGVRADIDPAALVDDDGHPLWTIGPAGSLRELVREPPATSNEPGASLFELPGRTWTVAMGPARDRAREAFTHPTHRVFSAYSAGDARDLAFVRADGPALVSHVKQLHGVGMLSPLGQSLKFAVASLPIGEHALHLTLTYEDVDSASTAESLLHLTFSALGHTGSRSISWLGSAKVERKGAVVSAAAELPEEVLAGLLSAGGGGAPPNRSTVAR